MNLIHKLAVAGVIAMVLYPAGAQAGSLLGGLIKTGSDSGNSSQPVSVGSSGGGTSIGIGGSGGVSVNLPGLGGSGGSGTSGGSGGLGGLGLGSGSTGIGGVATVDSGTSSGGGSTVGVTLLGGGGGTIGTNLGGLLGSGGGVSVGLPGLGGVGGLLGGNGTDGTDGTNGTNGTDGTNGSSGGRFFTYGGSGGGVDLPADMSSRLQMLLRVLAAREWIQLAGNRAICLPAFGRSEVSSWLPRKDWAGLQRVLPSYINDILTLRQLLANCASPTQRQALNVGDLNRVIGVDIQAGKPILYML